MHARVTISAIALTLVLASPARAQQAGAANLPPLGGDPLPAATLPKPLVYNTAIRIEGTDAYQRAIKTELDALAATPTGRKLLGELDAMGKKGRSVTIRAIDSNALVEAPAPGGFPLETKKRPDGGIEVVKPGPGADAIVDYDSALNADLPKKLAELRGQVLAKFKAGEMTAAKRDELLKILADNQDTSCLSPGVAIGHELIHALHATQGRFLTKFPYKEPDGYETNHEEEATAGVGPYAHDALTENAIRADVQTSHRDSYGGLCFATSPPPASPAKKPAPASNDGKRTGASQLIDEIDAK